MPSAGVQSRGCCKAHTQHSSPRHARLLLLLSPGSDGNPNVTAKTTHDVACLSRWMAADLYLKEVDALRFELSMNHASDEVRASAAPVLRPAPQAAAVNCADPQLRPD